MPAEPRRTTKPSLPTVAARLSERALRRYCTVPVPFIYRSYAFRALSSKADPSRRPPRPLSGVVQRTYDWDVGLEPSEGATNISSSSSSM